MLTAMTNGRVTARCFVTDLGLALAPKMCLDQSQAFKEVNNSQAFTIGREKWLFFWTSRLEVLKGMVSANIRRTDCVGPILSHI